MSKWTIREMVEDWNLAYESIWDILVNDLGLRRFAAKLVPKHSISLDWTWTWILYQKRARVINAKDMIFKVESGPTFIKRIITGYEPWVYEYNTQSRHQASGWRAPNELRPKQSSRFQSKKEAMLKDFIDYNGIVHYNFRQKLRLLTKAIMRY